MSAKTEDLSQIKEKMLQYKDLIGGEFLQKEAIKSATTKEELVHIFIQHSDHLEGILSDAQSSLWQFQKELKVTIHDY